MTDRDLDILLRHAPLALCFRAWAWYRSRAVFGPAARIRALRNILRDLMP